MNAETLLLPKRDGVLSFLGLAEAGPEREPLRNRTQAQRALIWESPVIEPNKRAHFQWLDFDELHSARAHRS